MAPRKTNVIDGFSSVQALKRVSERNAAAPRTKKNGDEPTPKVVAAVAPKKRAAPAAAATSADAAPNTADRVYAKAASHSVVPTKRLVICYECGYSHNVSGKMHHSFCPKCKTELKTGDVTVDGDYAEDIKTIGDVVIAQTARLAPGINITGQNITLDGDATQAASVTITGTLELRTNAKFDGSRLNNTKGAVLIPAGNTVAIAPQLNCRTIKIAGRLKTMLVVAESAHILPGGCLEGAFEGPTLLMDDGAGLIADVKLGRS